MLSLFLFLFLSNPKGYAQLNIFDNDISDWVPVLNDVSNPAKSFSHDANNTNDTQFTTGSQDPDFISEWGWVIGNTNNKGDISNAGAALIGNTLYFFGDRTAINGDANIGFWFFQSRVTRNSDGTFSGSHQEGDLLVLSNFTNGGGRVVLEVYEWRTSTVATDPKDVGHLHFLRETTNARVNTISTIIPSSGPFDASRNGGLAGGDMWTYQGDQVPSEGTPPPNTYHQGAFFEGFVLLGPQSEKCFTTFLLETRNSQSLNASLQDFVMDEFGGVPLAPATIPVTYCVGDAPSQLTASGTNLLWYTSPDDDTADSVAPTPSTASAGTTTYYVTQSYDNGCESERAPITVTVNPLPEVNADGGEVCAGDSIQLTATPIGGTWSGDHITASGLFNAQGLSSGEYIVTYNFINENNCSDSDEATVIVNPLPIINADNASVCTGESVQLTAAPVGGTWSGLHVSSTGLFDANGVSDGTYVVTYSYTNENDCTASDDATVTVNPLPEVNANNNEVCAGFNVQLSATPIGGTWTGDHVSSSGLFDASGLMAGTYEVTYTFTNDNECTDSDTAMVEVHGIPAAPMTTGDAICGPGTVSLSASGCEGGTLKWYTSAEGGSSIYAGLIYEVDLAVTTDFYVSCTSEYGCEGPRTIVTGRIDTPVNAGEGRHVRYCADDEDILSNIDLYSLVDGEYIGGTFTDSDDNVVSNNLDLSSSLPGTYIYTYTVTPEEGSSCEPDMTDIVIVIDQPYNSGLPGSGEYCLEDTALVSVDLFALLQDADEGGVFKDSNLNVITNPINLSGYAAGTYIFTYEVPGEVDTIAPIEDISSCSASTSTITITIEDLPTVTLAPITSSVCLEDGVFVLTGGMPEGGTYSGLGVVDNMDGTFSFDPSLVGAGITTTITYTYENENGCINEDSTDVTVISCVVTCDTIYGYINRGEGGVNSSCFLPDFDRWGWTTFITQPGSYTFDLYGGNGNDCTPTDGPGTLYGTATVSYTAGGKVTVAYNMLGSNVLNEAHVYIGCTPYPLRKGVPTVAPGQYNVNPILGGGVKSYTVEATGVSGDFYIIIHGVACSSGPITGTNGGQYSQAVNLACGETLPTISSNTLLGTSVVISPNPFIKDVKVNYSFAYNTKVKIDVMDLTGNTLKSYSNIAYKVGTKAETAISFADTKNKMYFVRVTTDKETIVKQIVSMY